MSARIAVTILLATVAWAAEEPKHVLPSWLNLGAEMRGRVEGFSGLAQPFGNQDSYYLQRFRLNATIAPQRWLKFYLEGQDSRVFGYQRRPISGGVQNPADLRQAYVELGSTLEGPWALRAGRQDLTFGDQRLIGAGDWGNVGRTFDAVRLTHQKAYGRFDLFAASQVVTAPGMLDESHGNIKLYGLYTAFSKWIPSSVVEPYVLWKSQTVARDERGLAGDLDLVTMGFRVAGKLAARTEYKWETALQAGNWSGDGIRAWAGAWSLTQGIWADDRLPRLVGGYTYASGDASKGDGHKGTFDQLYSANYPKYGAVDKFCWQNIHQLTGGVESKVSKPLTLRVEYHAFWLASLADALYTSGGGTGSVWIFNPNATSSKVADEIDFRVIYKVNSRLTLQVGYAHLFPGPYLMQSGKDIPMSTPYIMWKYRI